MDYTFGPEQNARQYSSHNQSAQGCSNKYSFASSNSPSPVLPPLPSKPFPNSSQVKKAEEQPLILNGHPLIRSTSLSAHQPNIFAFSDPLPQSSKIKPDESHFSTIYPSQSHKQENPKIVRITNVDKDKKVVSLIVTFQNGGSYDNIFNTVQQKTLEGTQVLVYQCNEQAITPLTKAFKGQDIIKIHQSSQLAREIVRYTKQIDPDCVMFNWQCCNHYDQEAFLDRQSVMTFLGLVISKGFMTMFSDYSLKALINDWDESILGKNPFKRLGAIQGPVKLKFIPSVLKECPSTQLQLIGELVEKGQCTIKCADNTILYAVDKRSIDKDAYTVQVLTIRPTYKYIPQRYLQIIDDRKGDAGHVLLRYKSGGMILTSMGHWIELMKIDPSEKKFFAVAQRYYGKSYAQSKKSEYSQLKQQDRSSFLIENSVTFVKNQSPCQTMNRKTCIY